MRTVVPAEVGAFQVQHLQGGAGPWQCAQQGLATVHAPSPLHVLVKPLRMQCCNQEHLNATE